MLIAYNIPAQNHPSFKAKIKFSKNLYQQLPLDKMMDDGKCVGFPWTMRESKMLKEGFSDGASVCIMGFIKSKAFKKGYLFHAIPCSNPFAEVKKIIIPVIEKFQSKNMPVEGILLGASLRTANSMQQAENFIKLFDDSGIKYSAFLGQKPVSDSKRRVLNPCPGVNMFASVSKDEYIMDFEQEPISSNMQELQNRFHIIKQSPDDKIIFE